VTTTHQHQDCDICGQHAATWRQFVVDDSVFYGPVCDTCGRCDTCGTVLVVLDPDGPQPTVSCPWCDVNPWAAPRVGGTQ